jgi:hypothetical protein
MVGGYWRSGCVGYVRARTGTDRLVARLDMHALEDQHGQVVVGGGLLDGDDDAVLEVVAR